MNAIKTKVKMSKLQATLIWEFATYRWHAYAYEGYMEGECFEKIDIEWANSEFNNNNPIAKVHIIRIPYDKNPRNQNLFNGCWDTVTRLNDECGELAVITDTIFGADTSITKRIREQLTKNDLYYIARIQVIPELRGFGFGADILKNLHQILAIHAREDNPVMVLIPSAFEFKELTREYEEMLGRLISWYMRNGFTLAGEAFGQEVLVLEKSLPK